MTRTGFGWSAMLAVVGLAAVGALWSCAGEEPSNGEHLDVGPVVRVSGLHVVGNRIVDGDGQTVRLRGFNHSGAEYMCVEGQGVFDTDDGGIPSESVVRAMRGWRERTSYASR